MAATEKKRVMVSLTPEQAKRLDAVCAETGLTKTAVMVLALVDWLDKRDEQRKR